MAKMLRLVAYIRVSRTRIDGISPELQRTKIEAYAAARGFKIVKWVEELDVSGGKADRPKFLECLDLIEQGKVDGMIVAKLDRFARSVVDAHNALRRITAVDGQLVSVEDGFDTSTPMGKFAMTMILALAELELDRHRENWLDVQTRALLLGIHVGPTPLGYRKRGKYPLEIDDVAGPVVRELFERRVKGETLTELVDFVNASGVLAKGRQMTGTSLAKLFTSRTYRGEVRRGDRVNAKAHKPLVSEQTWQAAQNGKQRAKRNGRNGHALLSGLIRCAGCRYAMSPTTMKDHRGDTIRMYACSRKHGGGTCQSPATVLARVVEPFVEESFLAAMSDEPGVRGESSGNELREAQAHFAAVEQDLLTFLDPETTRGVDRALVNEWIDVRQRALDEARQALDELVDVADSDAAVAELDLGDWPTFTVAERRRLLAPTIDAVMVWPGRESIDERALILWRGEGPADLPTRGRRSTPTPFELPR